MHSKELIKGTLKTIVLNLLAEQKRLYGYEITQQVKALSEGKIILTEGALYPMLHKLEAEGMLTTETVKIGKRIRKYYSLTQEGTASATEKVNEFAAFVQTMQTVLGLPKLSISPK